LASAEKFLSKYKKIVLKISSSKLLHKNDHQGVVTNIDSPEKLKNAWKEMSQGIQKLHKIDTKAEIIAQTQIDNGVELIVGVKTDPNFGKILLFGAGGIMVEILGDKNLHTLPMNESQILNLLETSKIYKLLSGYRGQKPYAIKKLVQTISKLISLALSPEIKEIEINPLIITHTEVYAVDGKILLNNDSTQS
jgi:acyl-CoA synthetase (NDP forming)